MHKIFQLIWFDHGMTIVGPWLTMLPWLTFSVRELGLPDTISNLEEPWLNEGTISQTYGR